MALGHDLLMLRRPPRHECEATAGSRRPVAEKIAASVGHLRRDHEPFTRDARRQHNVGAARAQVEPGAVTDLEAFVTARWALGSTFGPLRLWVEVDHGQWPLHRAELLEFDDTLLTAVGLAAPEGSPTVLWSPGVDVRIGRPRLAV